MLRRGAFAAVRTCCHGACAPRPWLNPPRGVLGVAGSGFCHGPPDARGGTHDTCNATLRGGGSIRNAHHGGRPERIPEVQTRKGPSAFRRPASIPSPPHSRGGRARAAYTEPAEGPPAH